MDNREIATLFSGYGYQVSIVETLEDIDGELFAALNWALREIRKIQEAARKQEPIVKPRWPMIVLRTPKGWSGPKEVDGKIVEGSYASHQVPLGNVKSDEGHLALLKEWLASYGANKLLPNGQPVQRLLDILPAEDGKKLGQRNIAYSAHRPLQLPQWEELAVAEGHHNSSMQLAGQFLKQVCSQNPNTFRIFSPDELESNKLGAVLKDSGRNFQWDQSSRVRGGRIIEILSEHTCQGFMQGYTLTGKTAVFPSYESFLGIVHTMMVQYAKFSKLSNCLDWRGNLSSINYIETSTWARQEHNGFSHQNPSFIGAVLNLKAVMARVYLPPDANCFLCTIHHCLASKNYVNLMIGSKQPTFTLLPPEAAAEHCKRGGSIWKFASTFGGQDPDVVLVGIGVEVTFEVIKAAEILSRLAPELRFRVVNVTDLLILPSESAHPHALTRDEFTGMFTADKPVCFNYHGYSTELQGLLFGRPRLDRMSIEGYREEGSTTTPFDMMLVNHVSRFHVAARALRAAESEKIDTQHLLRQLEEEESTVNEYIFRIGKGKYSFLVEKANVLKCQREITNLEM